MAEPRDILFSRTAPDAGFRSSTQPTALFATDSGEPLCHLLPAHAAIAVAATLAAVALTALIGGLRATHIEPSEGWRAV